MNFQHAAALALVGWYLMTPPAAPSGGYDNAAPLGKWFVYGGYDSAQECEGAKFLDREGLKQPYDLLADDFKQTTSSTRSASLPTIRVSRKSRRAAVWHSNLIGSACSCVSCRA
jgi:hypothetical protein